MSNNKQSSVDWLVNELELYYIGESKLVHYEIIEQAKEMHKEERISDYYQGACDESDNHGAQYITKKDAEKWYDAVEWYNETFNTK